MDDKEKKNLERLLDCAFNNCGSKVLKVVDGDLTYYDCRDLEFTMLLDNDCYTIIRDGDLPESFWYYEAGVGRSYIDWRDKFGDCYIEFDNVVGIEASLRLYVLLYIADKLLNTPNATRYADELVAQAKDTWTI